MSVLVLASSQNMCSLLIAHYSLLIAHYSLLIAHCSLLITHYSLLTTHCSLLITHCSLLITHCSLLTAHCFIKKVRSIKDGVIHVITLLRNKNNRLYGRWQVYLCQGAYPEAGTQGLQDMQTKQESLCQS